MNSITKIFLMTLIGSLSATSAFASSLPIFHLTFDNGKLTPMNLVVPNDKKFKLLIHNKGKAPCEFESIELNREQVVTGNNTITVYLGPLSTGNYKFYDDFHPSTAKGRIKVVRK